MGEFSIWHILLILIVVLIFFGPSRLPGLGNSLGKAIRGFKDGIKGFNDDVNGVEKPADAARDALTGKDKIAETEAEKNKTKNS